MARLTVEDCLDKVENRFDLVLVASQRARQLELGSDKAKVSIDNDKPTVLALREIAENLVDKESIARVSKAVEDGTNVTTEEQPEPLAHQTPLL